MSGPTLKVSNRSKMPPFMAMDVMRLAAELEADGSDIVHLEVGQPCSSAPQKVIDALAASMGQVKTHGYSVALGIPELRLRIADHYEQWYGEKIGPERVAVTVGSSMAFAISFLASFDIGDKIAIPNPGYPAYRNLMLGMGLEPVTLNAGPLEGWMPRLKDMEKWDNLPDGLMIASPHNPTGVIIPDNELKDICEWCDKNGVRLISDEIYHGLSYKSRCETALKYTDNVIVINSLSKYFSMTGWRIGWMILPEQLLNTAEKLAQNLYISAPTPNQIAAIAAFDCCEELDQNIRRYKENRNVLLSGLPAEFLGNAAPCDGAFYIYADISALSVDSVNFAKKLLDETGVATTPGVDFDPINGHRYLRLSFAGATQTMNEAVKRINEFVLTYKRNAA